jgi:Cdc6-like AAA superfamily ATPase
MTYRHAGLPPQPELEVDVQVIEDGTPVCVGLRMTGDASASRVRVRDLRAVPLEAILDRVAGAAAHERHGKGWRKAFGNTSTRIAQRNGTRAIRAAQREARRKVTPKLLAEVADAYRRITEPKVSGVADLFAVSNRTASRYIAAARAEGLI